MEERFAPVEDAIAHAVIGAAIEVHRCLGPGLLECVYEQALCHEFTLRRIPFLRQQRVPISYKGVKLDADLRFDVLVGTVGCCSKSRPKKSYPQRTNPSF